MRTALSSCMTIKIGRSKKEKSQKIRKNNCEANEIKITD